MGHRIIWSCRNLSRFWSGDVLTIWSVRSPLWIDLLYPDASVSRKKAATIDLYCSAAVNPIFLVVTRSGALHLSAHILRRKSKCDQLLPHGLR